MTFLIWVADHSLIISAIATVVAIALKFEKKLPRRLNSILFIGDIFLIVSSLLLGALKEHLDSSWRIKMEQGVKDANTVSAEATNRASILEAKYAPRALTAEQKKSILKVFASFPPASITVSFTTSDEEASTFGREIADLIKESKNILTLETPNISNGAPPGLTFLVHDRNSIPEFAPLLQSTLKETGPKVEWMNWSHAAEGSLVIKVGPKPIQK